MATLEDIVAATESLREESETLVGGSGSKPESSQVRAFDVNEVDGDSVLDNGLAYQEKERERVENLGSVSNGGTSVLADGSSNGGTGVLVEGSSNGGFGGEGVDVDLDGEAKEEEIGDKLEDLNHGFLVGDFVWGKIKSHPWWPGQVYDPKDASEFAVKHGQEGHLLVAFFGDGSCSWCTSSQLIPFVENFEEMSRNSISRSFHHAVERALDEVGRHAESEMTCKCIPEEIKVGLVRPVVANAGLKTGVLVPEVDFHRLCLPKYEPVDLLSKLRHFAKVVSTGNLIERAVLKSWLSAFYHFQGGFQLHQYQEPSHIEGLEDKNNNGTAVANDFGFPIEVPILGPHSDDKIYHRRKQKSVAKLMEENTKVKPKIKKRVRVDDRNKFEKSRSSSKQKSGTDIGKEVARQRVSSTGKSGRKRKFVAPVSPQISNEKMIVNTEDVRIRSVDHEIKGSVSGKEKRIEVSVPENTSGEANQDFEDVTTPRDRKKSKYLSPPYTNLVLRTEKASSKMESEIECDKMVRITVVGERMTKAAGHLFATLPVLQSGDDNASEEKLPDKSSQRKINDEKLAFSSSDVNALVDTIVSEIQSAALDPLHLTKVQSLDAVWDFVSAFRSSTFIQGSNYKMYCKPKTGKKRKAQPTQPRNVENGFAHKKAKISDLKPCKELILKNEVKLSTSEPKKADETSVEKIRTRKVKENDSPGLILTFTPEYPLPTKKAIVKLFSKFGSLVEKETKLIADSNSVQIVYAKDSDAEAAFKSSLSQSPFGFEHVNYRLQHSSTHSKYGGSCSISPSHGTQNSDKLSFPNPGDGLMSEVGVVKQKFEMMTSILENYHSKFPAEDKSSLMDEMKNLMENIEGASEKVRIVAEKTKS